jgi:hypothetical protein
LSETVSQTDANGNPVTTSTTTSDVGSDTEIEQNGVITDPGGTNTHTVTPDSTSGQTPPQPPGQPTSPTTAEPPSVNAIQQEIAGLQMQIAAAKKQSAAAEAKKVAIEKSWIGMFGYSAAQKETLNNLTAQQAYLSNVVATLQAKIEVERAKLSPEDRPPSTVNLVPLEVVDINAAGRPGFWTGLIPVYGSAANAAASFSEGTLSGAAWGTWYTFLAVTDVFLVRSVGTALIKGGARLLVRNVAANSVDDVARATASKTASNILADSATAAGRQSFWSGLLLKWKHRGLINALTKGDVAIAAGRAEKGDAAHSSSAGKGVEGRLICRLGSCRSSGDWCRNRGHIWTWFRGCFWRRNNCCGYNNSHNNCGYRWGFV